MSHLTTTRTKRPGFTLVELLAAMLIMAVLAAFFMSALQQVEAQARVERTKAMIARLDQLIMEKYASYRTRTIPLRFAAGTTPKQAATTRLNAIREIMRVELPDCIGDLVNDAERSDLEMSGNVSKANWNPNTVLLTTLSPTAPPGTRQSPALTRAYKSKVLQLMNQTNLPWDSSNENAECLYLIVSAMRNDTSSAIDYFKAGEIQNVDGDAIPEFVDAWGQPISFLRWAPGYLSDPFNPLVAPAVTLQTKDGSVSPDPYDPTHIDTRWDGALGFKPYALKPLIFSRGPDRISGIIEFDYQNLMGGGTKKDVFLQFDKNNDPYLKLPSSAKYLGEPYESDSTSVDNLTNHYIEVP